jgi:ATP-binding cassette subfamily G (WHITE) protein 2 (PDR)
MAMSMSMMFRFIGSVAKSEAQALAPASVLLLAIALYAGFAIPPQYMEDWFGWFRWINPVYYALESLLVNEFAGREYFCSQLIPSGPGYMGVDAMEQICSVVGSVAGEKYVSGQEHIRLSYGFQASHK